MSVETKPFDRSEIRPCWRCSRGLMHDNGIVFYEIAVTQCVVDVKSVQQQHGLEVMMGAAAPLAHVFAPSTRVAHRLPPVTHLICAECATAPTMPIEFASEE